MFEKQFNTTANQLGEGQSTNANCSGRAIGVTDYGFTGQRNETAFGLMDFNARYYSPRLGRFVSPDSIVPDPASARAYNRYMYADGNPLRFSDPSGHFSDEQLIDMYGENWQEIFSDEWEQLLLDNPNSQTLGAQLGDLVVMGNGSNQSQGVLVFNETGNLALWDVDNKTASEVATVGGTTPENLGLYQIAGGDSGAVGTRFGYLTGGTQYLPATNGSGFGPFTMLQLGQYSSGIGLPTTISLTGDWFMGQGGTGYYVHNYMAFQGFSCQTLECNGGAIGTGLGTADLANTILQGKPSTQLGLWGTVVSATFAVYGSAMYRPTYVLKPCPSFGPNYCQAAR